MRERLANSVLWSWINERPRLVLLALLLVHIAAYLLFGPRIKLVDDYHYINSAFDLIDTGAFAHPNTFAGRWVVFPLAASIQLFGASAYSVTLPALLTNLCCLLLVYWSIPKKQIALVAVFFLATSYYTLFHSIHFMPDVFVNALLLLTLNALYRYTQKRSLPWLLLASSTLVLAALMKLSALYLVPLVFAWMVYNRFSLKHSVHATAIAFGMCLLSLLFYRHFFGDAWFRLNIIEEDHNLSIFSYHEAGISELLKRLLLGPLPILAEFSAWGIVVLVSVLTAIRNVGNLKKNFWLFFALGYLALNWLGTTSLSAYNPLPVVHRMWTGSFLVCLVLLANVWHLVKLRDIAIACIPLLLYALGELGTLRWTVLLIIFVLVSIIWFRKLPKSFAMALLLFIALGNTIKYSRQPTDTPYSQFEALHKVDFKETAPVFARHPLHIKEKLFARINGVPSLKLQKFEAPLQTQGYLFHAKNTKHEGYLKKLAVFKEHSSIYYEDEQIIVFKSTEPE